LPAFSRGWQDTTASRSNPDVPLVVSVAVAVYELAEDSRDKDN
jgi:hypothetical protein